MEREKVLLAQEKETLLITLYGRAVDNHQTHPILADKTSEDVIHRIDYDFRKLKTTAGDRFAVVLRAKQLDRWIAAFLANNPDAIVLHLGCGLDTRIFRIDPPASVDWYDLDYPEVVALRKRLYPERAGYRMIASSVTDQGWLEQVPAGGLALIIAEGLTMYLSECEVRSLLERITNHFSGGEIAFDALSSVAVGLAQHHKSIKATGASITWGVDDPHEIESWNHRLKFVDESSIVGSPDVAMLPWAYRILCGGLNHFASFRSRSRLLRYSFSDHN